MSTPTGEMSRAALEDEVDDLRERVSELESLIEIRGADSIDEADVDDIWMCGLPVGQILLDTKTRSYKNTSRIDDLEESGVSQASGQIDTEARSRMIEVHRELVDWQDGAASDLDGSKLRAVVFFRQFVRNLDDDYSLTGISADHGKFKLKSERARDILDQEGLLPNTGTSMVKKRAMQKLVELSRQQDCDCSDLNCQHALFHWQNDNGYVVSVDQDAFLDYVATVQSAIEGVEVEPRQSSTADDGADAPEDVDEEFDRLLSAQTEEEQEFANSDVSGSNESALVGGDSQS